MEIIETLFLILTFCLGIIGMLCFAIKLLEVGFILMIITFLFGMVTLYISCKNTDK